MIHKSKDFSTLGIDSSWSLFLDRDGVINKKLDNDYVKSNDEFEWIEGVQEVMPFLASTFGKIVVVTNQQGIGKGIMSSEDLYSIHQQMSTTIQHLDGRIDKIYFAPNLASENDPNRKPNIGMALQAKKDFPEIEFDKSIMVGDSLSDMEFAKRAGMISVFIGQENKNCDFIFRSLREFAQVLMK